MTLYRLADGFSSADVEGMSLDPQASDPDGYQSPNDLAFAPATDGMDPASPGGPAPYNGAEPSGQPVTTDPMWKNPDEPEKPPYSPLPHIGPGPSVDVTTLHKARFMPMEETMVADLWIEASHDVELELGHDRMVRAKVASAAIWPFLSSARTEREFGHRLALCEDQLEDLFPEAGFRDQVTASLRDDYLVLKTGGVEILGNETRQLVSDPISAMAVGVDWERHEAAAKSDYVQDDTANGDGGVTNPAYFDAGPEAGPNTASDGQFAQFPAGPDPWNPMNAEYPMQPGTWTVPPDAGWVERPMELGNKQASGILPTRTAAEYLGEGVQTGPPGSANPNYFAAGGEGVAGEGTDGFAPDVTLPEQDERVDMYGAVQPHPSIPAQTRQAAHWVVAEKDNHGACAGCNSPVYREGDTWKHLGGDPGHGVRLHDEHPWLVAQQNNRTVAVRQHLGQRVVIADVSSSETADAAAPTADAGGGTDSMGAPPTPQSMQSGGAGAIAGTPLTIPNDQAGTNPFAGQGSGSAGASPAGANPYMASRWVVADTMNRPTAENPTGAESGDEYDVNNWNAPAEQRPRQNAEARGINTPQRPRHPIPIQTSEDAPGEEEEEDKGERQ